MSKINAVRFINLNYNNNAIRIADETFQMGGKSTLMSLRNGGGKSVLVQMMTAPFVHRQYRKTKDRPFESYFTTAKPTFILVEWELDSQAGFCLTGMMVRKNQSVEEGNTEPLEIVNFIAEYPTRCEIDIYHLPVVEKKKNEIILKSFQNCKQIFEGYKKEYQKKFFYYDMNNYAQSRQYFEKLSEYKIFYKEWEGIIRKVNLKESGLSELFSDCRNEKELIEKWFVEAIENKLNREQNRMREFQTIIEKYVQMYKDNKSKIERRDTILKFKEDMQLVEEKTHGYLEAEERVKNQENRIAALRGELERLEQEITGEKQTMEEKQENCKEQISYILYEKLSMEIQNLEDELKKRSSNFDMLQFEMDDLEREIEKIEKTLHLYECAKQQLQVEEEQAEYEVLKQKLDVIKSDEKELEPERKQLGGYLRNHFEKKVSEMERAGKEKEEECRKEEEKIEEQKKLEQKIEETIKNLLQKIAFGAARLENFQDKEQEFNVRYHENLGRNILGEYEPGLLEIKGQEYDKQKAETSRNLKEDGRLQLELQEKKKEVLRNKEDKMGEKMQLHSRLKELLKENEALEKQMQERQRIMRYLEAEDFLIWQQDKLLEIIDHKLADIDMSRKKLEQEEAALQQEWKKLTSGELLELPTDFQEILVELELHPVYGMQWLEKNGYSRKENQTLVRRQPFLPYSLILPRAEIKKLQLYGKEIYTSYPIPLIARENLEEAMVQNESRVLELAGISFYLWFNENLLDEEALRLLILKKEEQIKKKQEQLQARKEEYQDYADKKSILKNQTLSKKLYDENQINQTETEEKIKSLEEEIIKLQEEAQRIEEKRELLEKQMTEERQQMVSFLQREEDFNKFCREYEGYLQNQKSKLEAEQEKERCEERKNQTKEKQEKYLEKLRTSQLQLQQLLLEKKKYQEKLWKYSSYEALECEKEEKTESLEARYEAITSEMSLKLKELEENFLKAVKRLEKAREELKKKQKKYGIKEEEWLFISYQEEEQLHQEILLEDRKNKYKRKEVLHKEEDKQIGILESKIQDKKKGILEQCGYEKPLEKSEIHFQDFDARINQLKYELKEYGSKFRKIEEHLQSISQNRNVLMEYENFVLKEEVSWEKDIASMDAKALAEFSGMMRRDYREETVRRNKKREGLQNQIQLLLRKEIYQEEYYRKPLEAMLAVSVQAAMLLAQLSATIQSYDSQMEKLAVDIAMVEKEKEKIAGLLEDYVKEVHQNMARIDGNSTITIRNRAVKMLRLQLPDWEENAGLYRQRLEDYMEELTKGGVVLYEQNENAANFFSSRITTRSLYDTIVGIGNIQMKLYKIEEMREYPITWSEVAKNSGGEGFLSAFVILSSLLHYMRRDETDIFADRNEGKVLVMDNPFAQTNAAHLLKPLMDMAKKTNTQLICLSGLGGDSIYSRFDNIYVLNLVTAGLRGGVQYLRGEHTRGTEEEIMVASQIEVLGQELLF